MKKKDYKQTIEGHADAEFLEKVLDCFEDFRLKQHQEIKKNGYSELADFYASCMIKTMKEMRIISRRAWASNTIGFKKTMRSRRRKT